MRKRLSLFLALTIMVFTLFGCANETESKTEKSGFYFDTIITITLYESNADSYIDECFAIAKEYEDLLSNTIPTSDISRINSAGGKYVKVSPKTIELLKIALSYCDSSDGAFDITIGKLSSLWDISELAKNLEDNEGDISNLPTEDDISDVLPHIDYNNVSIKDDEVCLLDPEAMIDLGAIAKGYIADRMKDYLLEAGFESGIINLGGNVLVIGDNAKGQPYTIGIQKPFDETGAPLATIKISDASAVTSGVYQRYIRIGDDIYHHLLDTKTGYPIRNDILSVTIISDKSVDGDALSTTCFALGVSDGIALVEQLPDTEAIYVLSDYSIVCSSGADAILEIVE